MNEPGRYRKRPIEVTAIRWTGENYFAVSRFAQAAAGDSVWRVQTDRDRLLVWIEKLQREGPVEPGGWIIAERDGVGCYPCTPAEFEAIYEPVE